MEPVRRFHGQGLATETGYALIDAAATTGRRRLWATLRAWNAPSLRVVTKLGFDDSARVTEDEHGELDWWTRTL